MKNIVSEDRIDISFDEDTSFTTDLSADDVDGDTLIFDITGGNNNITYIHNQEDESITFTPIADFNGIEIFTAKCQSMTRTASLHWYKLKCSKTLLLKRL